MSIQVSGRVLSEASRLPLASCEVSIVESATNNVVSTTTTDADGRFSFEACCDRVSAEAAGAHVFHVTVANETGQIADSRLTATWSAVFSPFQTVLADAGLLRDPKLEPRSVQVVVVGKNDSPASGREVRVFRRRWDGDDLLGTATTNSDGVATLRVDLPSATSGVPSIFARVDDSPNGDAESKSRKVRSVATRLSVSLSSEIDASEYARVNGAILAFSSTAPAGPTDPEHRAEAFASELGLELSQARAWVWSEIQKSVGGLSSFQEALYGLHRDGIEMSDGEAPLARYSARRLHAGLDAAVANNWISGTTVGGAVDALRTFSIDHYSAGGSTQTPLARVFEVIEPIPTNRRSLVEEFVTSELGLGVEFLSTYSAVSEAARTRYLSSVALLDVFGVDADALAQELDANGNTSESLDSLADRPTSVWPGLVASAYPTLSASEAQSKASVYTARLWALRGTRIALGVLTREEPDCLSNFPAPNGSTHADMRAELATFRDSFADESQTGSFNLLTDDIDDFVAEHQPTASLTVEAREVIRATGRICRLVGGADELSDLLRSELASSHSLRSSHTDGASLLAHVTGAVGGAPSFSLERADELVTRANLIADVAARTSTAMRGEATVAGTVFSPFRAPYSGAPSSAQDCEHCASLYSPSAYLVELWGRLDNVECAGPGGASSTLWERLKARRDDLEGLSLGCDSTHTEIRYANKVLEVLRDGETVGLSGMRRPWTDSFDAVWERAAHAHSIAGVSRADVLRRFSPFAAEQLSDGAGLTAMSTLIALQELGLSPRAGERLLETGYVADNWIGAGTADADKEGLPAADVADSDSAYDTNVSVRWSALLFGSCLDHQRALDLVGAVDSVALAGLLSSLDSDDAPQVEISPRQLRRMRQLEIVSRATGWDIPTTAAVVLGPDGTAAVDGSSVELAGAALEVQRKLGVSTRDALSFVLPLEAVPSDTHASYYHELLAIGDAPAEGSFESIAASPSEETETSPWTFAAHTLVLQSRLAVSRADASDLLEMVQTGTPTNSDVFTTLHRASVLIRSLRISASTLRALTAAATGTRSPALPAFGTSADANPSSIFELLTALGENTIDDAAAWLGWGSDSSPVEVSAASLAGLVATVDNLCAELAAEHSALATAQGADDEVAAEIAASRIDATFGGAPAAALLEALDASNAAAAAPSAAALQELGELVRDSFLTTDETAAISVEMHRAALALGYTTVANLLPARVIGDIVLQDFEGALDAPAGQGNPRSSVLSRWHELFLVAEASRLVTGAVLDGAELDDDWAELSAATSLEAAGGELVEVAAYAIGAYDSWSESSRDAVLEGAMRRAASWFALQETWALSAADVEAIDNLPVESGAVAIRPKELWNLAFDTPVEVGSLGVILAYQRLRTLPPVAGLTSDGVWLALSSATTAGEATDVLSARFGVASGAETLLGSAGAALSIQSGGTGIEFDTLWPACVALGHAFTMQGLIGLDPDAAEQQFTYRVSDDAALVIANAVRASRPASATQEFDDTLAERLLNRERAALVSYRLHEDEGDGRLTPADLSEFYLIDVETTACKTTTEIQEAMLATQSFVSRVELGLEVEDGAAIALDDDFKEAWQWLKNYRLWEANRKVLLYPENYLRPELRDSQTHLFEALRNSLDSADVSPEAADEAVVDYLIGLRSISSLEVVAMFDDTVVAKGKDAMTSLVDELRPLAPNDPAVQRTVSSYDAWTDGTGQVQSDVGFFVRGKGTVYVVAREPNAPHEGFLASRNEDGNWSSWEKLDTQLESANVGLNVIGGTLILAWMTVTSAPSRSVTNKTPNQLENQRDVLQPVDYHLSVQYRVRSRSGWSGTRALPQVVLGWRELDGMFGDEFVASSIYAKRMRLIPHGDRGFAVAVPESGEAGDVRQQEIVGVLLYDRLSDSLRFSKQGAGSRSAVRGATVYWPTTTPGVSNANTEENETKLTLLQSLANGEVSVDSVYRDTGFLRISIAPTHSGDDGLGSPFVVRSDNAQFFVEPHGSRDGESYEYDFSALELRSAGALCDAVTHGGVGALWDWTLDDESVAVQEVYRRFEEPKPLKKTDGHPFGHLLHGSRLQSAGSPGRVSEGAPRPIELPLRTSGLSNSPNRGFANPNALRESQERQAAILPLAQLPTSPAEPYGIYGWELFYHVPMLVAERLSAAGHFEDARVWLQRVWDPTDRSTADGASGAIRFVGFQRTFGAGASPPSRAASLASVQAQWNTSLVDPFDPHAIASLRPTAYYRATISSYLQNLLDWGDARFTQFTAESIAEALLAYGEAHRLLSSQPTVSPIGTAGGDFDYGTASSGETTQVNAELFVEVDAGQRLSMETGADESLLSISSNFCVPMNDHLASFRGLVSDRLFKIRNCLDIDGVARQPKLWEDPIDPMALVEAVAGGGGIGAALAGLNRPVSTYRFGSLLGRARAVCASAKALAGAMLSAFEKRDAETLSLLRSAHEETNNELARTLLELRRDDAAAQEESIDARVATTQQRLDFYRDRNRRSKKENRQIGLTTGAIALDAVWGFTETMAGVVAVVPEFSAGAAGAFGSPMVATKIVSGQSMQNVSRATASAIRATSAAMRGRAGNLATKANWERRDEEWDQQVAQAELELEQLEVERAAVLRRVEIAEAEYDNHVERQRQSSEVSAFLQRKFTNAKLYSWMSDTLKTLYRQTYGHALDLAREAEFGMRFELAYTGASIVGSNHWSAGRQGLLAGERLERDLDRLSEAFQRNHTRELSMTTQVSLRMLNPRALLALRESGNCEFAIPEAWFDEEHAGHFLRRIKSVAVSVATTSGRLSGVHGELTMLGGRLRRASGPVAGAGPYYGPGTTSPDMFRGLNRIAISSGQGDTGVEPGTESDGRYLPFEGAGAADSEWLLSLPARANDFLLTDVEDVVLTIRYTARRGDAAAADAAREALDAELSLATLDVLNGLAASPPTTLDPGTRVAAFGLRAEFPDEWQAWLDSDRQGTLDIDVDALTLPTLRSGFDRAVLTGVVAWNRWTPGQLFAATDLLGADSTYNLTMGVVPEGVDDGLLFVFYSDAEA